ncbi:hypothetical protein MMC07_003755 [Pseudocyphellaria aurata]|nr:hypothetical protein [Pseudocyphellaria aurata]
MAPRGSRQNPLPPSPAEAESPSTWTPEQNARLFEIHCQNLQNQRDLAVRKPELGLECMRNEPQARIAAASTAATATTRVQAAGPATEDDEMGPLEFDSPPASYLSSVPGSTAVEQLAWYGLSADTRKGYQTAINSHEKFCILAGLSFWPATAFGRQDAKMHTGRMQIPECECPNANARMRMPESEA